MFHVEHLIIGSQCVKYIIALFHVEQLFLFFKIVENFQA